MHQCKAAFSGIYMRLYDGARAALCGGVGELKFQGPERFNSSCRVIRMRVNAEEASALVAKRTHFLVKFRC